MLVVDDVKLTVCDYDAVTRAEALSDELAIIEMLFDKHHRVSVGILESLYDFHYVGSVRGGAVFHILVVPGEVLDRIHGFDAEGFLQAELAKSVGIGTFRCEITTFIVVIFAESSRGWTVQPAAGA